MRRMPLARISPLNLSEFFIGYNLRGSSLATTLAEQPFFKFTTHSNRWITDAIERTG